MNYDNRDDFKWLCLGLGTIAGATGAQWVPYQGLALAGIVMVFLGPMVRRWATRNEQRTATQA